ncbi:vitamin K epoxide reductase family protein [Actinomycetaceae bacterium TAE3-ERU4]|nr:vitamin K epoxide reductase family protein [Actinomycetaceae bacterium TAE3-ERU4]
MSNFAEENRADTLGQADDFPVTEVDDSENRVEESVAYKDETVEKEDSLAGISEKELYAELAERNRSSEHELAGGLDFWPSLTVTILSLLGLLASAALVLATIGHAQAPDKKQSCDINSWISCGASLSSWKSALFGVPNALLGVIAFSALTAIGVLLLSRVQLPRWVWLGLFLASMGAVLFVYWFAYESAFSFKTICPWCLLVWIVTIALFVVLSGRALKNQLPGMGWLGRPMVREWWAFLVIMYTLIAIVLLAGLGTAFFS